MNMSFRPKGGICEGDTLQRMRRPIGGCDPGFLVGLKPLLGMTGWIGASGVRRTLLPTSSRNGRRGSFYFAYAVRKFVADPTGFFPFATLRVRMTASLPPPHWPLDPILRRRSHPPDDGFTAITARPAGPAAGTNRSAATGRRSRPCAMPRRQG